MCPVTDDDWRLMGQERWLRGVTIKRADWSPRNDRTDHDHCAFCTKRIAAPDSGYDDAICTGYCTLELYHWVCPQCFNDFRDRFQWTLAS